jgi:hypothetical protein
VTNPGARHDAEETERCQTGRDLAAWDPVAHRLSPSKALFSKPISHRINALVQHHPAPYPIVLITNSGGIAMWRAAIATVAFAFIGPAGADYLATYIPSEIARWAVPIKASGVSVD